MHIFKKAGDIHSYLKKIRSDGQSVGFVPTMGALHEGHLSLTELSLSETDVTLTSIFVNPTQFNESTDYQKYPRTTSRDIALLESIGCQVLFLPDENEMYPDPSIKEKSFDFGHLEKVMEGANRPGHFQGVGQVISRFLEIIPAGKIYLGQKDFQQVKVITKLANEILGNEVKIRMCPIRRETDGLAMSSRNVHLTTEERQDALVIYKNLSWAKSQVNKMSPAEIKEGVNEAFSSVPTLEELEYFEIVDAETLNPAENWSDAPSIIACVAARFPSARLIDNMYLKGAPY